MLSASQNIKYKEKNGVKKEKDIKKLMDEKTQEIEKENQNLKALEESDDPPQSKIKKTRDKYEFLKWKKNH